MSNKLKEAIELVDKLLNFTVYEDLIDHHDTVCKELPKLRSLLQEASHVEDGWVSVEDRLPEVKKLGDGNFCNVKVKTGRGLEGIATFGCSGFMGEGYDFSNIIRTIVGNVNTRDKIVQWIPIPPTQDKSEVDGE